MATDYERYAIYWVPASASRLGTFGAGWTGWCAEAGTHCPRPGLRGLPQPLPRLTADLSRHGLHGVLRAPFRLGSGRSQWALERAVQLLADETPTIILPGLRMAVVGGRVALVPEPAVPALNRLVARIGRTLLSLGGDTVLRPGMAEAPSCFDGAGATSPEALRAEDLPVIDAHRFHVPLTDRVPLGTAYAVVAHLRPVLAPILAQRLVLGDLALVGDPGGERPWRVIDRYPLALPQPARRDYEPFAVAATHPGEGFY